MRRNFVDLIAFLLLFLICLTTVNAQTTGSIAGIVSDANGALVPNATVTVRNNGSGQEFTATTTDNGTYAIPALGSGLYNVTVTAPNFKKAVVENVKVDVGTPATADVGLVAGNVDEVVVVSGGSEVLQTQTATIATTITGRQITETPLTSRDGLDLVTLLPGTAQVGRPRQSTINGLPKGALSITIDGVDVQDNLGRSSDGFFTFVRPRLDSIEEVTVSTAAGGAESGGDGAVQIKFVTKRGTNAYRGGLFWQHRDQGLNSNYFYNNLNGLPRNPINLNQYGGTFGGPIPYPNFGDGGGPMFKSGKDRAFFFINYEEFRIPESINRTRTILSPDAANGVFRYGTTSVNLLQIAQNAGFTSTVDPTIGGLMAAIRSATSEGTVTATTNPNTQFLNYIAKTNTKRNFLALRFDVNITKNHSIENIWNRQIFGGGAGGFDLLNNADPSFPGFPNFGDQSSSRYSNSTAVRSTLTNNLINEARFALLYGDSDFRSKITPDEFANQGGRNLNFNFSNGAAFLGLTNITAGAASTTTGFSLAGDSDNLRSSPNHDFTDNLTWIKGNHSMTFGGQYKVIKLNFASRNQIVPRIDFGIDDTDPVDESSAGVFTTCTVAAGGVVPAGCNFPNATAAQLAQAKGLYALLVGRVVGVSKAAFLAEDGTYSLLGNQFQSGEQKTYGLYAQDVWRIRPNLTLSFGLRWQPQDTFTTTTNNFSYASEFSDVYGISGEGNLFKPGTLTGRVPTFKVVDAGFQAYEADKNNFAPSVGVVYSPDFGESGFLKNIFGGSGTSVFRGGFSRSFVREGTNLALTILSNSPGAVIDASLDVASNPDVLAPGSLLRNLSSVPTPGFPSTPPSLLTGTFNDSIITINPKIKTGTVDSWSVGYQRQLGKDTVIEARYVGNRGKNLWRLYNIDEINVTENGFSAEFRLAQANLAANNTAGGSRAGSYAYFGAGTGTTPLPILQAYFRGAGDPTVATQYTNALYRSAARINDLSMLVPNVRNFAANIENNAGRRLNAGNAGLAENFFYVNPTTLGGGNFIVDNAAETSYDALQIELRRRLSHGLLVQGSYTFSKSLTNAFASSAIVQSNFRSLRDRDLNKTLSPFDVTHAFKVNWIYELPFGKNQPFFSGVNRWTNFLVGGWSVIGAVKLQSGTPINFGNVNLVGMTREELEKEVGVYFNQSIKYGTTANPTVVAASYLPVDIIQNSFEAANNRTFTGRAIVLAAYGGCIQEFVGECGFSNLVVHGPKFFRMDLSLSKKFQFDETRNVELRVAAYNALNNTQFRVGGWAADLVNVTAFGTGFGQLPTGSAYQDTSTTNDQGGRTVELILRINF